MREYLNYDLEKEEYFKNPKVFKAFKFFGEILINKRVNKPPVRTASISWPKVAIALKSLTFNKFVFSSAPQSFEFINIILSGYYNDEIFKGLVHYKDWNLKNGYKDIDLPDDPRCKFIDTIIESVRLNKFISERFVPAAQRKLVVKAIENEFDNYLRVEEVN